MKTSKQGTLALATLAGVVVVGGAVVSQNQSEPQITPAPRRVASEQAVVQNPAANAEAVDTAPLSLDVPYVPTPEVVVDKMLELTKPTKDDVLYDLGCGDGRIVITAAKKYGLRGVGVDIDPQRIRESNENAQKAGVSDRVKFTQQDLFKTNIGEASVLTLYLLPDINLRLRPQIFRQSKPGTRIVSHAFSMGDWKPDQTVEVRGKDEYARTVYYWVLPANVAGTWQWQAPGGGQSTLKLNQRFQEVSGALNAGGAQSEIGNVKLVGDQLSFTVTQGNQTSTFNGRVNGNTLKGTMRGAAGEQAWEATRDAANVPSLESITT